MAQILGTNISAPVVPFSTDDIFATHYSEFGRGGYRSVATLTERDAIKELRRENLMLVAVADSASSGTGGSPVIYQLILNNPNNILSDNDINNNNNWVPLEFGSGDDWVLPAPLSSFYPGETGQRSYDDDFVYICIDTNVWKRISMDYFVFNPSTSGSGGPNIQLGEVPIFDGNGGWNFDLVVKNIQDDGSNGLLVTFTDNSSSFLNIEFGSGDNWILPPPISSAAPGIEGQRSYDNNYLYIAVQDNLWKRINLDFFVFNPSTSGTIIPFNNGDVPVFENGTWNSTKVVQDISSTSGGLNVLYTDNTINFISNNDNFSTLNSTSGTNIVWDYSLNKNYEIVLEGNSTLSIININNGDKGTLIINQLGNYTLNLPVNSLVENNGSGSVTLTGTLNAIDILEFVYNGVNIFWKTYFDFT